MIATDKDGHQFRLAAIQCPICLLSDERVLGLRGGRHQRWNLGVETRIVQCKRCSLVYPNPFPYPLAPQALYGDPAKYFEGHDLEVTVRGYEQLARQLARRIAKPQPRILDIGAGRGDFVHAATRLGLATEGLEFSQAMIAFAKARFSVTLRDESAEDLAQRRPATYDGVMLNAVLEHVYDPGALMRAVSTLLKPGGVLYIDVPNEPNLLTFMGNAFERACGREAVYNLQPTWAPFHVFGFNPIALRHLCEQNHIRIERMRAQANPAVRANASLKDRLKAFVARQVQHAANLTHTASNLFVWARKEQT
jgi:2-polyprenyl-3-methyl-5-hydroxy-6-metoxy-1,4-benzoquinol methylase